MGNATAYLLAPVFLSVLLSQGSPPGEFSTWTPGSQDRQYVESPPGQYALVSTAQGSDLPFIENIGQFPLAARFYVRDTDGKSFWLGEDSLWITMVGEEAHPAHGVEIGELSVPPRGQSAQASASGPGVNLRLLFLGMNPQVRIVPFGPRSETFNYLLGNDPEGWYPDVPTWGGVRYVDFYPGLDLEVTSKAGQLILRMDSRSEANLRDVALTVEGHDAMSLAQDLIVLRTALGDVHLPLLQVENAIAADVPKPKLQDNTVYSPFAQAADPSQGRPSDLRPTQQASPSPGSLLYSTYLGGTGSQFGQSVAVDSASSAYVVGSTYSSDFPTTPGAFQTTFGGGRQPSDAFVAKFTADGSDLIFATFLGGSGDDRAYGVDVDSDGAVYITGTTNSDDFPTTAGAYDVTYGGGLCGIGYPCFDAFVTKLNASGTQAVYSTYLGSDLNENSWDLAIDQTGAVYVAGHTQADDDRGFVTKLDPDGSSVAFTVPLDGSDHDSATSVALGEDGEVYAAGHTISSDFPVTPGAYQTVIGGGICGGFESPAPCGDAFVAKIDSDTGAISFATFLGGTGDEVWAKVAADQGGHAFVTGQTSSSDFPTTPGSLQASYGGGSSDAFLSKLDPAGSDLVYSTYRGGSGDEYSGNVEVNATGWAYLLYNPNGSVVFEELNAAGSDLLASASLDGSDLDYGNAIAIQGCCVFITGYTRSDDFPTTSGAFQTSFGGASDGFVAKIEAIQDMDHTIHTEEQGFDKCVHPNVSEMQTWRAHSPYRYIGIYIGGDGRACDQPDLNLSWISAVGTQGWGFIPIWVGPQAPRWANPDDPEGERRVCADRDFPYQIDLDPEIAREQGILEAGDAVEAAYQLGLVDETRMGTIIYYDLERFQSGEPECESAANGFIEGWVSELHRLGNEAGLYGHVINVDHWYTLDPKPDAIWFAYYPVQQCPDVARGRYCYDPNISVYGIPTLPDDHWQQERLRQYNNSHKEPYGDIEFTIDSDAADGIVAVPAGADPSSFGLNSVSLPSSSPVSGLEFTVRKMDLITSDVGWAIINNRLRWTGNGGEAWEDITPIAGAIIEDVFFLNTSEGWAMSAAVDEMGAVSNLYLSSTTDAGQSWQTSAFDAFDPLGGYSAIYLDFIDSQSGWVVIRLPSSSNFSFGQLYKTTDGGASWSQLDIPLGEPVNFITTQVGWVAGGAAGDQLFVTRDGGASWEQQEVVSKAPGGAYLIYHLPTFGNSLEGILPLVVNDLPDTRVEFYGTSDGGLTWTALNLTAVDREIRPGTTFPIAVTESGLWRLPIPASLPGIPSGVTALDFVSAEVGWAYTTTSVCNIQESGLQGNEATVCTAQSQLLRTEDGGQTWSESILPVSNIYLPLIPR